MAYRSSLTSVIVALLLYAVLCVMHMAASGQHHLAYVAFGQHNFSLHTILDTAYEGDLQNPEPKFKQEVPSTWHPDIPKCSGAPRRT